MEAPLKGEPPNGPEPTRWAPAQTGYGTPSPKLPARANRGLARFLGDQDEGPDSAADRGEA
ncbi:hypothetical protein ACIPUC_14900 [Streptomyces sp. LARHCF249]